MVTWRQESLGPVRRLTAVPQDLCRLTRRQFEELIAELLAGTGWNVELTAPTRRGCMRDSR